jgi:HSP20 family protein
LFIERELRRNSNCHVLEIEPMPVIRWAPFSEVALLQNSVNSFLQDFSRNPSREKSALNAGGFVPPVDVYEDEHKIVLTLEIPGVKQDDIDIRLENNSLTVRGERKFEKEQKEENFHRIERRYGSFFLAFTLPTSVDGENIKAQYDSGILKLELNKRAEAKPKQIKIGVSGATQESPNAEGSKAAA